MNGLKIIKSKDKNERLGKEHFIETKPSEFYKRLFDITFGGMIKKSFYSVRIKNSSFIENIDKSKPIIFYANHTCWWDGLIAYILCRKQFNVQMHMMVEELFRFPLLRKIGGFSVEKSNAKSTLKAIDYSINVLKDLQNVLWLYPEGIVKPPDHRPIKFASGIAYISQKLEGVNLVPVAQKYTFLREDRPEILVEIGKPIIIEDKNINRKELTTFLEDEFTKLLDSQLHDISLGKLDDYEFLFKSRLCFTKLVEQHYKSLLQKIG